MPRDVVIFAFQVSALSAMLSGATAIHCGRLLDVRRGVLIDNAVILLDGNNILAAGPVANVLIPGGSINLDVSTAPACPVSLMFTSISLWTRAVPVMKG